MINQLLVDFIKSQLLKGSNKETITKELLANDWTAQDIEEGFNAANITAPSPLGVGQSVPNYINNQPAPITDTTSLSQIKYAGFWTRFVAYFIDGLVLFIPTLIIFILLVVLMGVPKEITPESIKPIVNIAIIISLLITWTYNIFMIYKYQATLGKKAVGIKVFSNNPQISLSLGKVILRETVGKFISGFILSIGYIMAGFTEKKQALHDKIADTVVVQNDPNKKMPKWIIITIVVVVFVIPFTFGLVSSVVLGVLNKNNENLKNNEQNSLSNPYVNEEYNFSFSYPENINLIKNENKDYNVLSLGLNYNINFKETNTTTPMPLGGVQVGEQTYQNFIEKMKNTKTLNNISEEVIEKNGITWNIALIKDVDGLPTMKRIMTQKDNLNYGLLLMYSQQDAEESKNITKEENDKINAYMKDVNDIREKTADTFINTFKFTDIKQ